MSNEDRKKHIRFAHPWRQEAYLMAVDIGDKCASITIVEDGVRCVHILGENDIKNLIEFLNGIINLSPSPEQN